MPTHVTILVYVGDPVDAREYRHTALFFKFPDGSTALTHAIGTHGLFQFSTSINYDPDTSVKVVKTIPVAELPDSISQFSILGVVQRTQVKNDADHVDWNCHNWVNDAMIRMVTYGYLTEDQRTSALDKMIDATMEAKDDQ